MHGFQDIPMISRGTRQIARSDIYAALKVPVEPCDPPAALCSNEPEVDLNSA